MATPRSSMTSPNRTRGPRDAALSPAMRRVLQIAEAHIVRRDADAEGTAPVLRQLVDRIGLLASHSQYRADSSMDFPAKLVDAFRKEVLVQLAEHGGRVSGREMVKVLLVLDEVTPANPVAGAQLPTTATYGERLASLDALQGMTEIAHDMRSPLAAILLLVEPIRRGQKGPVTPVQERQLGLVYGAALSLSSLANDIIEAARADRSSLMARPFSVRGTLDDAAALVRPIAEEKRLELRVSYPQADARVGDAAALHRVILNLVTNALKYTDAGYVSIECTELDDDVIEFAVQDSGEGIPPHALTTLSDELRSNQSGLRYTSSGLGLAICKALLEKMDATLNIEPRGRGEGTRISFRVRLPQTAGEP